PYAIAEVEGRVDRDPPHGHLRWTRRARDPEIADVLRIGVWESARPSVRVDGSVAVRVVEAEVKMRAGRRPGHTRDPDHLAPLHVLAPGHVDLRQVAVVGEQPVAVIDLHRQPAQATVA